MAVASTTVVRGDLGVIDRLAALYAELHEHHASVAPELLGLPACSAGEAWRRRREHYFRWLESDGAFVVLASANGDVAGFGLVTVADGYDGWGEGGPIGELKDLVVARAARRLGLATAIVDAVRDELARSGVPTLRLNVLAANSEAREFYARYGLELAAVTFGGPTI